MDKIISIVDAKGDTFISTRYERYTTKSGDLSKNPSRLVTFMCAKCGVMEEILLTQYKLCKGRCKKCRKILNSESWTITNDQMKEKIESTTALRVLSFDNKRIFMNCGEHIFDKPWHELVKRPWCSVCAVLDNSVCVHVDLSIKNNKKNKIVKLNSSPICLDDINIALPDKYSLISNINGIITIRCNHNHIRTYNRDQQIICNYTSIPNDIQIKNQKIVQRKLKSRNDSLLSVYINQALPLEIQCGVCKTIFYKSYKNYIQRDIPCPKCMNIEEKKKQKRIEYGLKLKNYVEQYEWTWCDDHTLYKNNNTQFKVKCPLKHDQYVCLSRFMPRDRRCSECAKIAKCLTVEQIDSICLNSGVIQLDKKHRQMKETIKIKCIMCDSISDILLETLRYGSGKKCKKCNSSKSAGELKIRQILQSNSNIIEIIEEFKFDKEYQLYDTWFCCKDKCSLRYDFYILLKNGIECFIEFDGSQHFSPTEFFGGIEGFNRRREHDLMKSLYCFSNNRPLLRISYTDFKNIEYLVNNFVEQLISGKRYSLQYSNIKDYSEFCLNLLTYNPPKNLLT